MTPVGPPAPPPPAIVLYEDTIPPEKRGLVLCHHLSFVGAPLTGTLRVTVTDNVATTVQFNSSGIAELRSVHTSLRKKAHERTTAFERNFTW
jgi:hypothetical protein